jgi:hypothetical protein
VTTPSVDTNRQYTVTEVHELTGLSERAISKRMDRGTLGCVMVRRNGRRQRLIPGYALMRAGLAGTPRETQLDRQLARLLSYLQTHPDRPITQHTLRLESGATRQAVEVAMSTLLALGHVRKSEEPPPAGTGRPRIAWRWVK